MTKFTNNDLMNTLGRIEERIEATHNLAVKTNGRVTALEKRVIGDDAVTAYKQTRKTSDIIKITGYAALIGAAWWVPELYKLIFHK